MFRNTVTIGLILSAGIFAQCATSEAAQVSAATPASSTAGSTTATAVGAPAAGSTPTPATTAAAATPAATPKPVDAKLIESSLRDSGDTLKKIYHTTDSLQAECSRAVNLDAWDNAIMDPWMEGNPGLAAVAPPPFPGALKPIPPRKKWIEYDINQLTQLLKILTTEVNDISAASTLADSIRASVDVMQDTMQQVDALYATLNTRTHPSTLNDKGQPNYDKVAILKATQALKDETSGLNEIRKRLLRQVIENEGKSK